MIVTCDLTATIRVFYDSYTRYKKVIEYLEKHGWKKSGALSGSCVYRNMQFLGYAQFCKQFDAIDCIKLELSDIDIAFNDGWIEASNGNQYYHNGIESYDKGVFDVLI
jgi:hypothetical protein